MPLSESEIEDAKATILIELERMFTIVSNYYKSKDSPDNVLFLIDVEKALRESLVKV